MPVPTFASIYDLAGVYIFPFLGAEQSFRLAALTSCTRDPTWRESIAGSQALLRLVPVGSIGRVMALFPRASAVNFLIRHENHAAQVGLFLAFLPDRFRLVRYILSAQSLAISLGICNYFSY